MNKEELFEQLEKEGIKKDILEVMKKVDRKDFIPEELKDLAYENVPLYIGYGQTISQPYTVGFMLQNLEIKKREKVLEIGTGSGWNAALISKLVGKSGEVYTIERIKELYEKARKNLLTYKNVHLFLKDGSKGLKEFAPFDKIIVTAACSEIPEEIIAQLNNNGILIVPVNHKEGMQKMIKLKKTKNTIIKKELGYFVFVPLIKE